MADNTFTSKAIEHVSQAIAADQAKKYKEAFELYQTALQYFITALKYEKTPRMREILTAKLSEYMTRAEQLKEYLSLPMAPVHTPPPPTGTAASVGGGGSVDHMEAMKNAILRTKPDVKWDDVAGLHGAKEALKEAVILPIKFPQLFTGPRKPWTGILMYGPPGTGKSYLAKAVATEADSAFITVSPNDLISKWQGDSERLLHSLFETARENKPSIIFVDELDALLPARSDSQSDSIHRFINQFLQEMDGVGKDQTGVLVLGATNTPWTLDSAVRRRFQKRVYIGLPDVQARFRLFELGIGNIACDVTKEQFRELAMATEGYTGSDISTICRDAIMAPVRKVQSATHFKRVTRRVLPCVTPPPPLNGTNLNVKSGIFPDPSKALVGLMPCSPGDKDAVELNWERVPTEQLVEPVVGYRDFIVAIKSTPKTVSAEDLTRITEYTREFGIDGN